MTLVLILILNLAVGVCIGLTGIAGFLLPMFYTGFLGMPADQSLALSFSAFLISGVLGSVTYYREGNLAVRPAVILSAGSLVGAVAGVRINLLIPENVIQIVLYVVVLLSGISILLRREKKEQEREKRKTEETAGGKSVFYLLLGLVTGAVCAASGAGGPVLVMPLLTLLGFPAHTAVGMSLFNSIFIALPAAGGYLIHASGKQGMFLLLVPVLAAHGIGVAAGSRNAARIDQLLLKRIVAVASILIALVRLFL